MQVHLQGQIVIEVKFYAVLRNSSYGTTYLRDYGTIVACLI